MLRGGSKASPPTPQKPFLGDGQTQIAASAIVESKRKPPLAGTAPLGVAADLSDIIAGSAAPMQPDSNSDLPVFDASLGRVAASILAGMRQGPDRHRVLRLEEQMKQTLQSLDLTDSLRPAGCGPDSCTRQPADGPRDKRPLLPSRKSPIRDQFANQDFQHVDQEHLLLFARHAGKFIQTGGPNAGHDDERRLPCSGGRTRPCPLPTALRRDSRPATQSRSPAAGCARSGTESALGVKGQDYGSASLVGTNAAGVGSIS
jgi:hypothetical protein